MDRRTYIASAGSVAAALTLGVAGCSTPVDEGEDGEQPLDDGDNQTAGGDGQQGTPATVPDTVDMVTEGSDYYFDPIGLSVESGTEITWVNGSGTHSSTAYHEDIDTADVTRIPTDADPWDSGTLTEQGTEFSHTFDVAGTYDYFCIPHKALGMIGRLVVDEPGGVEGNPPDGDLPEPQRIADQGAISYEEFAG